MQCPFRWRFWLSLRWPRMLWRTAIRARESTQWRFQNEIAKVAGKYGVRVISPLHNFAGRSDANGSVLYRGCAPGAWGTAYFGRRTPEASRSKRTFRSSPDALSRIQPVWLLNSRGEGLSLMDAASLQFIAFGFAVALISNFSRSRVWRSCVLSLPVLLSSRLSIGARSPLFHWQAS